MRYGILFWLCAASAALAQNLGDYAAGPSIAGSNDVVTLLFNAQAGFSNSLGGFDLVGSFGNARGLQASASVQSIGVLYHAARPDSKAWEPYGGLCYMHAGSNDVQAHGIGIAGGLQYITGDDNVFRPSAQINVIDKTSDAPVALSAEWQWVWKYFYLGFAASASFDGMGLGAGMGWRLGDD